MPADPVYPGRLAIQQRVLPAYRVPFVEILAGRCAGGLSIFAGQPRAEEEIAPAKKLEIACLYPARNRHLFRVNSPFYQCRQEGLLDWLEAWNPDALIVEANPRYASTPGAIRWMHSRGKLVLGWGLGAPEIGGLLASWRRQARQRFLRALDGVIAYSQRGAVEYRMMGFPPERIFVAPNAVASRPSFPLPLRPSVFQGRPTALYVGRLQRRKRIDLLIAACARLPEALRPHLWVVGDGPARQELQELATRLYPDAEFSGARFGAELERFFKNADVFILPGTGGLAVQQAMSFGLPVIVAQGDGTQDDLVRPENGWRIPADDRSALASALQEALSDPERLRRMGAASYRIVTEEVNLEQMAAAFVAALNSIS